MSDLGGRGLLREPSAWLVVGLVAARLLAVGLLVADAADGPVTDRYVLRAERVVTSPAEPYADFPVEWMPIETSVLSVIAGDGASATAIRLVVLSFVADLAAATAVAWGWGRRAGIVYLLLGLPLLSIMYLRFELVGLALAVLGLAWLRSDRTRSLGGVSLGIATLTNLAAVLVLPVLWVRRAKPAAISAGAILLVGGAAWYLTGGPKAPFQVLSFRHAFGWSTESLVGNLLDLLTAGATNIETDVLRIGHTSTIARLLLAIASVAGTVALWRRANREDADPAAGVLVTAMAIGLICWPHLQPEDLVWLLPFAAIAFEGDARDRAVASLATASIALTGLVVVGLQEDSPVPDLVLQLVTLARNVLLIAIVVTWFRTIRTAVRLRAAS